MVTRIFNWLGSGVFRTIGRFVAYIIIGLLVALLLKKTNINLPSFFLIKVNASEIQSWSTQQTRLTYDDHGSSSFSSWETAPYTFTDMSLPVKRVQFRVRASDGLSRENSYNFTFGYLPNPDSVTWGHVAMLKNGDSSYSENNFTCGQPYLNSNNYYLVDCSLSPQYDYSSSDYLWITIYLGGNGGYLTTIRPYIFGYDERLGTNAVITNSANSIINNNNSNTQSIINNNNQNTQQIIDSNKVCTYIDKNSIAQPGKIISNASGVIADSVNYGLTSYIKITSDNSLSVVNSISYTEYMSFYDINKNRISTVNVRGLTDITIPSNASYFIASININNNRPTFNLCKNGNQAITDTLEDDDVEGDTNDMADFLNDFELSNDGVISTLVTLPITFLENILTTDSTADLCATYKGQRICLPSGNMIWGRDDISAFKTFFNLLVGGYLSFKMLRSFIYTSEEALNPKTNKIEVMKL